MLALRLQVVIDACCQMLSSSFALCVMRDIREADDGSAAHATGGERTGQSGSAPAPEGSPRECSLDVARAGTCDDRSTWSPGQLRALGTGGVRGTQYYSRPACCLGLSHYPAGSTVLGRGAY